MGNQEFFRHNQLNKQWIQVAINGKNYIKNMFTSQNFQFKILHKNQKQQQISKLIERSIYNIPKTPKTIIINQKEEIVQLLVQVCSQRIRDKIPKITFLIDILQIIKDFAITAQRLYKKYGPFKLTEQMMGFSENSDVLMWINEDPQKTNVQYILQGHDSEFLMVQNILIIINMYSLLNINLLLNQKFLNFSSLITYLNTLILEQKICKLQAYSKSSQKSHKNSFSPQNRLFKFPNSFKKCKQVGYQNKNLEKIKNKKNIPQFIKKQTTKNVISQLTLKNIPHKRTVTIEDLDQQKLGIKFKLNQNDKCINQYQTNHKIKINDNPQLQKNKNYECHKIDNYTSSTEMSEMRAVMNANQTFGKRYNIFSIEQFQIIKNCQHMRNQGRISFVQSIEMNKTLSLRNSLNQTNKKYKFISSLDKTEVNQRTTLEKQFNQIFEPITQRNEKCNIIVDDEWSKFKSNEELRIGG